MLYGICLIAFLYNNCVINEIFILCSDLYESFGLEEQPLFVGALLFFFIFDPIWRLKKFFTNLYVWQFEKDADKFAAKLGYAKV